MLSCAELFTSQINIIPAHLSFINALLIIRTCIFHELKFISLHIWICIATFLIFMCPKYLPSVVEVCYHSSRGTQVLQNPSMTSLWIWHIWFCYMCSFPDRNLVINSSNMLSQRITTWSVNQHLKTYHRRLPNCHQALLTYHWILHFFATPWWALFSKCL